jgi:hypothetical protein
VTCIAQQDSSQNLYFVNGDGAIQFDKNDYQPGRNAFHIYRNCIYDVVLNNKKIISMRVVDIRNDSIYYTTAFNHNTSTDPRYSDTLALHPLQLKRLKLIGDRLLGLYTNYSLTNCRYVFEKSPTAKVFPIEEKISYASDSSNSITYELVYYLTAQGLNQVFEQRDTTYYYLGADPQLTKNTLPKAKPRLVKNWFWFSPSHATQINGLCVGLESDLDDEPLIIKGVNLNSDGTSMFIGMFSLFRLFTDLSVANIPDTVATGRFTNEVNGLSISLGGLMGKSLRVRGLSINGVMSAAAEMTGLHITTTQNRSDSFKGVIITGFTNRAIRGRGLQIGLVNTCKDLKGIQLGLWNMTGKRSLPFINWGF